MLHTLLALAPIAVVFVLMVVMARSATLSMGAAYLVTAILALLVWGAQGTVIAAATVHGIITAITLLFIVFGAVLLLDRSEERRVGEAGGGGRGREGRRGRDMEAG